MTKTYRITPRAQQDFINIGRYTLKKWGRAQRNSYLGAIEQRFKLIAENPNTGRHRTDVKEAYFCWFQGSHMIFYLIREDGVDIIGIPHQRMDILNYFSSTSFMET
jgi:toxin ParE1/3/4